MNRRDLLKMAGLAAVPGLAAKASGSGHVRFAAIADTHVIDEFYKGPEGNPLDSETILAANTHFTRVRDFLNGLHPALDGVFIAGDFFHNYPSTDWDFFMQHRTRVDIAKSIVDGFRCPCHPGFGNHDYDVPNVSREFSHRLFQEKLKLKPYYSVEIKGCRFIHLNNLLGETWDSSSKAYQKSRGSFGVEQLEWFDAELKAGQPAFVFLHYPLLEVQPLERADFGIHPLLRKHRETIQAVISGHWHKWFDMGFNFGPRHYVIASTRYDENAYMIIDADLRKGTHRVLNMDGFDWTTHYAKPWKG